MNMKMRNLAAAGALAVLSAVGSANAATCVGACGALGADGVVVASPSPSGPTYNYVTTTGGLAGVGQISGVGGTDGSEYSIDFAAAAADKLSFYFNYVTSDGADFSDYAWAELRDNFGANVAYLFTGRTTPSGDTSPGFGLPANASTLTPSTSAIIGGAPAWSPLGSDSGLCFSAGCGYTGWILSEYTIAAGGNYSIVFGVTNSIDTDFDSGLAFAGTTVGDVIIQPPGTVPLPAGGLLLLGCLGGLAALRRRQSV